MILNIQNQGLENSLLNIANSLQIDTKTLLEKVIQDFVLSQEEKRANTIVQNVSNGYNECIEAKQNGKKLQSLDSFLDEL